MKPTSIKTPLTGSPRKLREALLLSLTLGCSAQALAASGSFSFVTGDVRVQTGGRTVPATRGMEVNPGDLVLTGADGMAQLAMVDSARLSLRSNSQLRIEAYARSKDDNEGAVLSLLRGTLRTFTSLVPGPSRDKYTMRTKVATVGIRGSGNILYHCDSDCPADSSGARPQNDTTLNHTIEGSHSVQTIGLNLPPVVTGPGQTVQILSGQPPQFVPTPDVIKEAGRTMTAKANTTPGPAPEESRSFSAPDPNAGGTTPPPTTVVGNNGLGFTVTDASGNITSTDPLGIRDIVFANGFTVSGQATAEGMTTEAASNALRAFTSYAGLQNGASVNVVGGSLAESRTLTIGGTSVTLGRWTGADVSVLGTSITNPGGVHFAYANAGFPAYLSEVLTGEATYALTAATSPTNQNGVTGNLGTASVAVNFSNRTLNANLAVTLGTGNWTLNASNVPISLNSFFASTGDRLVVGNGAGQTSRTNSNLFGSIEGSFVGTGLAGIILGYSFGDFTTATNSQTISGVAALTGTAQPANAEYRVGLVSDVSGVLANSPFFRNLLVFNRPAEVTQDAGNGGIRAFSAPTNLQGVGYVPYANYTLGTASLVDAGFDPATGLSWGRWSGGIMGLSNGSNNAGVNLQGAASLHYIFASSQSGPVSLPLTGTATYDVVGSTRPTSGSSVGTFNSATLNANFTARTVDFGVNFTNNGQTWNASASNVPIYRDLTFGAYAGTTVPGFPSPAALTITCNPNCGQGATGAVDGFFTGRTGRGAGMMYNVGGNTGAVAFSRRGG